MHKELCAGSNAPPGSCQSWLREAKDNQSLVRVGLREKAERVMEGEVLSGSLQVKGKTSAVQVYSVAPWPDDSEVSSWNCVASPEQHQQRIARRKRRKRASTVVHGQLQSKSGAKMKPLIGREQELEKVTLPS